MDLSFYKSNIYHELLQVLIYNFENFDFTQVNKLLFHAYSCFCFCFGLLLQRTYCGHSFKTVNILSFKRAAAKLKKKVSQ
jgi:hypothetical protein